MINLTLNPTDSSIMKCSLKGSENRGKYGRQHLVWQSDHRIRQKAFCAIECASHSCMHVVCVVCVCLYVWVCPLCCFCPVILKVFVVVCPFSFTECLFLV